VKTVNVIASLKKESILLMPTFRLNGAKLLGSVLASDISSLRKVRQPSAGTLKARKAKLKDNEPTSRKHNSIHCIYRLERPSIMPWKRDSFRQSVPCNVPNVDSQPKNITITRAMSQNIGWTWSRFVSTVTDEIPFLLI
jgi:hypothetical protein